MKIYNDIFPLLCSIENLFGAWEVFKSDKRNKPDVVEFEKDVEKNLFQLRRDLVNGTYRHGRYYGFWIRDPKLRRIHKATVRDRVLHHAIFRVLNPIFEPTFISTSYSCRIGKGTHKGVQGVASMLRAESRNNMRRCWALKCDVRKFFDSVDHDVLLAVLAKRIQDKKVMGLMCEVIESFSVSATLFERRGIPIGNLTSQLFANIYMNEFDQFVKHELHLTHYARYTDDFVIVSTDKKYLEQILPQLSAYLEVHLRLTLHPRKVILRPYTQGVDFLGYVIFPDHILVRKKTERRMFRKLRERIASYKSGSIKEESLMGALRSYRGVLSHASAHDLDEELQNDFWFRLNE